MVFLNEESQQGAAEHQRLGERGGPMPMRVPIGQAVTEAGRRFTDFLVQLLLSRNCVAVRAQPRNCCFVKLLNIWRLLRVPLVMPLVRDARTQRLSGSLAA